MKQVVAKFECVKAESPAQPERTWVANDPDTGPVYEGILPVEVAMVSIGYNDRDPASEDNAFARSTPAGSLSLRVMNNAIQEAGFFEAGAKYRLYFERVED